MEIRSCKEARLPCAGKPKLDACVCVWGDAGAPAGQAGPHGPWLRCCRQSGWSWHRAKFTYGNFRSHLESLADGVASHLIFFPPIFPPETPAPGPRPPSSIPFLSIDLISSVLNKRGPLCARCQDKTRAAVDCYNTQLGPIQ